MPGRGVDRSGTAKVEHEHGISGGEAYYILVRESEGGPSFSGLNFGWYFTETMAERQFDWTSGELGLPPM